MDYLIATFLIACSALFSGLTLGYFSLETQTIRRRSELGDPAAAAIYPLRQRGNQLLTTLLLGNVAVNTILAIFLSQIAGGVAASIVATTLIFLFGEIIPQAVISRHALYFGASLAPIVRILMIALSPITYPIAYALNRLLGDEMPTVHSKQEIMQIISEHEDSEHSPIDADEERIVHGALQFSHKRVSDVMTLSSEVMSFRTDDLLNSATRHKIIDSGFSRFPVYHHNPNKIVGILYTKDVLLEDQNIPVGEACEKEFLEVTPGTYLDTVLKLILSKKMHLCVVRDGHQKFMGVITLEDILEEIIQYEIEDEDD